MACNRQPGSVQDVDPHGRPDGWTEGGQGRMTGRAGSGAASFGRLQGRLHPSFTISNDAPTLGFHFTLK